MDDLAKPFTFGPVLLTTTSVALVNFNPAISGSALGVGVPTYSTEAIVKHVRIVNKTGTATTFKLTTNAPSTHTSTVIGDTISVPANSAHDWYGNLLFSVKSDRTVIWGQSFPASNTLTFECEGTISISNA